MVETWKMDNETIEMCVCYFIKMGYIPHKDKWKHIETIKEQNDI